MEISACKYGKGKRERQRERRRESNETNLRIQRNRVTSSEVIRNVKCKK